MAPEHPAVNPKSRLDPWKEDTNRVTDQPEPVPQRIGDAERDRAAELLRDHLAEGRLDQAEFDERLTIALTAKTAAELDPLFRDLPGPKPGSAVAPSSTFQPPPWQQATPADELVRRPVGPPPANSQLNKAWALVSAIAWPLAIIACFATDWRYWWIILIPIIFPWWMGQAQRHENRRHNRF
jgi:hypothetical protein